MYANHYPRASHAAQIPAGWQPPYQGAPPIPQAGMSSRMIGTKVNGSSIPLSTTTISSRPSNIFLGSQANHGLERNNNNSSSSSTILTSGP